MGLRANGRPGVRGSERWGREALRWPQPEGPGAPELTRAESWKREDRSRWVSLQCQRPGTRSWEEPEERPEGVGSAGSLGQGPGRECGSSGKLGCGYRLHREVQKRGCWRRLARGSGEEAMGRCDGERVRSPPQRNRAVWPFPAGHPSLEKRHDWSVSLILEGWRQALSKNRRKPTPVGREVATSGRLWEKPSAAQTALPGGGASQRG